MYQIVGTEVVGVSNIFKGGGGGGGGGGGPGPTFSGGWVSMLICIGTRRTCDFPGGSGPPIPLWIRTLAVVFFFKFYTEPTWTCSVDKAFDCR